MIPEPRFQRFEKVIVGTMPPQGLQLVGQTGTVLWADPPQRPGRPNDWAYCVHLPGMGRCVTALEQNLRPTGEFDQPESHVGTRFEISHDLLPDERGEFAFVEGTFRVPGKFWEVMIFIKGDTPTLRHRIEEWPSGMTGVVFRLPQDHRLDKAYVLRAMSGVFPGSAWVEVSGPDSMILR